MNVNLILSSIQSSIQPLDFGRGIRYLLKSWAAAGFTETTSDPRLQLNMYRRSPYRLETMPEEDAVAAWNMALKLTSSQMFHEAKKHILHAASRYKLVGSETQVSECEEFLEGLEEATRCLSLPSKVSAAIKPTLTWSLQKQMERQVAEGKRLVEGLKETNRRLSPPSRVSAAIVLEFSQKYGLNDMSWLIA